MKSLDAPYEAGRRGAGWLKVKPRHTLDLVVLAAEWGHGRRRGWLSNLHLARATRDAGAGRLRHARQDVQGPDRRDARLADRAAAGARRRRAPTGSSQVRPELVVEIAFDGVQTSPRYPAGLALRFARVLRTGRTRPRREADTIDAVRAYHEPRPGTARAQADTARCGS